MRTIRSLPLSAPPSSRSTRSAASNALSFEVASPFVAGASAGVACAGPACGASAALRGFLLLAVVLVFFAVMVSPRWFLVWFGSAGEDVVGQSGSQEVGDLRGQRVGGGHDRPAVPVEDDAPVGQALDPQLG